MALAWVVGTIGFAAGVYGCVLLASNPRRRPRAVNDAWTGAVSDAARDTLAVVRSLAAGVAPDEVTAMRRALSECAQRLRRLQQAAPTRDVDRLLEVAAMGAELEATRLSGVAVMHGDRRAFLAALRTLRAAGAAGRPATKAKVPASAASAGGEVSPTFTVA